MNFWPFLTKAHGFGKFWVILTPLNKFRLFFVLQEKKRIFGHFRPKSMDNSQWLLSFLGHFHTFSVIFAYAKNMHFWQFLTKKHGL
jgi:hypothetical protein